MNPDQWFALTLAEQLGNIGSDFDRALHWRATGNQPLFQSAAARTMDLLNLTVSDPRWQSSYLGELNRIRNEVTVVLNENRFSAESGQSLQQYFLRMATLAQREHSLR
jgi:hypothetical protein